MAYQHLTREERYQIQALHEFGHSCAQIGDLLRRDRSTIYRELKNNSINGMYLGEQAQIKADAQRKNSCNARTIDPGAWEFVCDYTRLWLSPDQVAQRLYVERKISISHESIYQYIYLDHAKNGELINYLRCQKKRRKRYGSGRQLRGTLKNRVGIEQRPAIVEKRIRFGDWEGDTVIGKGHQGVLLTLVERKSRYTLARPLACREADMVQEAIIELLRPHRNRCHTLTFDNGKEFAQHEFIGKCLNADVYFARPYHSWERGTNENTNGLLRQFFPKGMSFKNLSTIDVDDAVYRLNHRPRKCLGYRTPHEVFFNLPITPLH